MATEDTSTTGLTPLEGKRKKKKHRHRSPSPTPIPESEPKTKKKKKVHVITEFIPEAPDRIAPFVGYFPSGYNPLENNGREPEVVVFRNKKRPGRVELVVRPKDSMVDFAGKSYVGESATPKLCSYALGVFDKESNELKIVPIATDKVLRLEPRITGKQYYDLDFSEGKKEEVSESRYVDRVRELTNLYGSKRNKGYTQRFKDLEDQKNNPEANEYLEDQMKDVEVNKNAIECTTEILLNIPPHDLAAVTPEGAYLLNKIIPKAEWVHLSEILQMTESGKDLDPNSEFYYEKAYPSFVLNRLSKMRDTKDTKHKEELGRILSYITHLINFMDLSYRKNFQELIHSHTQTHNIPRIVFQKFVQLFVDPESYRTTADKRSLLISYVLVLTLFVDKFSTNVVDIVRDLKMKSIDDLKPHCLQLGCKFLKGGLVTLSVPLNIPSMKKKRFSRSKVTFLLYYDMFHFYNIISSFILVRVQLERRYIIRERCFIREYKQIVVSELVL